VAAKACFYQDFHSFLQRKSNHVDKIKTGFSKTIALNSLPILAATAKLKSMTSLSEHRVTEQDRKHPSAIFFK
jgi:hypothetical protein